MRDERTPEHVRAALADFTCPWCGAGPFKVVALHTNMFHGVDRLALRDAAGLPRRTKITPKDYSEKLSESNRDRLAEMSPAGLAALDEKYGGPLSARALSARQKFTDDDRARIAPEFLRRFNSGQTIGQINEALGISLTTSRRIMRENGVSESPHKRAAQIVAARPGAMDARRSGAVAAFESRKAAFIARYDELGHTEAGLNALAEESGVARKQVIHRLKGYGCEVPDLRGVSKAAKDAVANRPVRPARICEMDGCPNKHVARGMCATHYNQLRRNTN